MIKTKEKLNNTKSRNFFIGKKLLILSGGHLNIGIVEKAKELGIITYVVDNNDSIHSPAKKIADKSFDIDIYDVDKLVDLCKKEKIDGVISLFYNVPIATYYTLCKRMNYYCYANKKQFDNFNSKLKLKKICAKCEIETPVCYKLENVNEKFCAYPIIVKPDDSSGSKGQKICHSYSEVKKGVEYAKKHSKNEKVIIEEYVDANNVVTIECLVKNGEISTLAVFDMYNGDKKLGLDRVYELLFVSNDVKKLYKKVIENDVKKLIKANEIQNGFCVIQGLQCKNSFKIIDASIRLGGSTFCSNIVSQFINLKKIAIKYALTGEIVCDVKKIKNCYEKNKKIYVSRYIILKEGKIAKIDGIEKIMHYKCFVNLEERLYVGDVVKNTGDTKQILCAVVLSFNSKKELLKFFEKDNFNIKVFDENNNDIVVDDFARCKEIIINKMR